MTAYYNEIDPYAAQWLRNLIAAGHIAHGIVDERSIEDVQPRDLHGFTQCHFFAGIGGWSLALRMAGWDDSRPVWTGSCPCQPFSVAGRGEGTADERHLWPVWFNLIRECQPKTVFGEQVEAAIRHGWLDLVQADMEGIGYAVAAAGIPACGVGAPHIRQRLWFVANNNNKGLEGRQLLQERIDQFSVGESGVADRVGDTEQRTHGGGQVTSLRTQTHGLLVQTENTGQLNPAHCRWLMGYPTEWDAYAPMATPSSRKSRKSLLNQ